MFHFSLERVLKYKQHREWLAEIQVQQALGVLKNCQEEEARLRRRLEEAGELLRRQLGQAQDVTTWLARYQHSERIGRALAEAMNRVQHAHQAVAQARDNFRKMAVEAEALRQVRQRQWEVHRNARQRTEQIHLDDVGLRRWNRPAEEISEEDKGP